MGGENEFRYSQGTLKGSDSSAFSAWFGQSKVAKRSGEPIVVYHGTDKVFDAFHNPGHGIFFTQRRKSAWSFALTEDGHATPTARLLAVYLSLQNPLVINRRWLDKFGTRTEVKAVADEELIYSAMTFPECFEDSYPWARDLVYNEAIRLGHDGMILQADQLPDEVRGGDWLHTRSYVAFHPNQIKCAKRNVGTFDPAQDSFYL